MISSQFIVFWMPIIDAAKRGFHSPEQTYQTLTAELISMLESAANRARQQQFSEATVHEGLFAVVAWIDEMAMTYNWSGALQWRRTPLQRHFFSTNRAGVEFFQRLNALPTTAEGARELFGLALLNGFQGYFATRPENELAQYRRLCLEQIADEKNMKPLDAYSDLFEQPKNMLSHRINLVRRGLSGLALFMLTATPLVLLFTLYISFDLSLAKLVSQFLEVR